jgi:competence protein ComEA
MPTPSERKALLFLSALLVLGGAARAAQALGDGHTSPSTTEVADLDRQIGSVDSARRARKRPARKPKRLRALGALGGSSAESGDSTGAGPGVPQGSGLASSTEKSSPRTVYYLSPPRTASPSSTTDRSFDPSPVDMDRASAAEMERLPRVGPVLARRIVADRDSLGPFGSLKGLQRVRGVGPALARILAPYVTFSLQRRPPRVDDPGARGAARKSRARHRRTGPP